MTETVRLRRWQRRALERLDQTESDDFLAVATPGSGKTTFALTALRRQLARHPHSRVVVAAPTAHLKTQWRDAARHFGLTLADRWRPADGSLPADVHGIVTTYQQLASSAEAIGRIARGGLVVLDEIHHAADERAWGQGTRTAFADAVWRLALSGTPFRSDSHAIPFVRYALDEAMPDFEYGYGDALADAGVIRPIEFPALDGDMEWVAPDGATQRASFADPLTATLAAQRLRTALSPEGDWLPTVIDAAQTHLDALRRTRPDAAALVIAIDQDHARAIARMIRRRHGAEVVVATSDDAAASERIARFATSRDPWLVAVRMVSEGVDIPRLAVGVYATTTTTELFFRQAVGRLVRHRPGDEDLIARMFIPDDPRLRRRAADIERIRRHHLRTAPPRVIRDPDAAPAETEEQMSLFAAVSATPIGSISPTPAMSAISDAAESPVDGDGLTFELPPLPRRVADHDTQDTDATRRSGRARRDRLRALNAARAGDLVRHANLSHAKVNAELNRLVGIERVTEATVTQLQRRLEAADRWLRQ